MEFTALDPAQVTSQDVEDFTRLYAATDAVDHPGWPVMSHAAMEERLRNAAIGSYPAVHWLARIDGRPVAVAAVQTPQEENRTLAIVWISVHPQSRRQGIGTEFLRVLLPHARAAGRSLITGMNLREDGPGQPWASKMGFKGTEGYLIQLLDIAGAEHALWDVPAAPGYRIRQWVAAAPQDLLASYAHARQAISDAPSGDLTWQDPAWTAERVRQDEAELAAIDAQSRVAVAVHEETGEVAAITELFIYTYDPGHAHQSDTAVLAAHRGHGLGRAVKAANLRRLVRERPETVRITTQTSTQNVYMDRVNRQLGYRTLWTNRFVEAGIDDLEKRLGILSV